MPQIIANPTQAWQVWIMRALSACVAWFLVTSIEDIKDGIKFNAVRSYANEQRSLQNAADIQRQSAEIDKIHSALRAAHEVIFQHSTQIEVIRQQRN